MFLKKTEARFRVLFGRIGLKMTFLFLIFFIASSCLLFALIYLLFSKALKAKDHEIINTKFQEMSLLYQDGGLEAFHQYFADTTGHHIRADFYFRIVDAQGRVLFLRQPSAWGVTDVAEVNERLASFKNKDKDIVYVKTSNEENDVEVLSGSMSDGSWLSVGKGVDDRDDLFELFERIFLAVLLFTLALGGIGGFLFANHLLKPLRRLISTIRHVSRGDESARVAVDGSHDELAELTLLFNRMLDHVQESNQAMRQTLDTVAHDLRTPLTSVRAQIEWTLQQKNLPEAYHEILGHCIEGIDEALYEFKIMTDIAEVESGLRDLRLQKASVNGICHQVQDLYEIVAEQKNIRLVVEEKADCEFRCDYIKIRQAVANLVDNAIKYSPANGAVTIAIAQDASQITIEVRDQGIGIPAAEVSQVFKRLYRGENSRHEKGLGLGLSLVRSIVEAHGGQVNLASEVGRGSTFIITLPRDS